MTITQNISGLPTPPDPAVDSQAQFSQKASAFTVAMVPFGTQLNTLISQINAEVSSINTVTGIAMRYTFSTITTDADPGPGSLRLSNATQNLSTVIRMDLLDANNLSVAGIIDTFDDSTSTVKGTLKLQHASDATKFLIFNVTALASPTGYKNVTVTPIASSAASPFIGNDSIIVAFVRAGDAANGFVTEQDIQNLQDTAFTAGGTSTAYTLTPSPASSGNAANQSWYITFNTASGASPTLAVSGQAALPLVKQLTDGTTANIQANDIPAGHRSSVTNLSGTSWLVRELPPVVPMSSGLSFRNKIRNGGMDIAQRGVTFAGLGAVNGYTLDGWVWSGIGISGVVTVSQQLDAPADNEFQNSMRVTVTTSDIAITSGKLALLSQPVEGYLVRDLIGRPIAIQFRVRSAKTGTHCVSVRNGVGDRSWVMTYTVNAANTWETKYLVLPDGLITAGTWNWTTAQGITLAFVLAAGTTYQTASPNTWVTGNVLAVGAQVNCLDTVGNIFAITGVQLEKGSSSGPFEHVDFATELVRSERYFEKSYDWFVTPGSNTGMLAGIEDFGVAPSSTSVIGKVRFRQHKRAVPSVQVYDAVGNIGKFTVDTVNNVSPTAVDAMATTGFKAFQNTCTRLTFHWTTSAEL